MRWPKYWSYSFSISPSKEHAELISFRIDWLDLLAVQGTLKSLLQHHSSNASILRGSAFFTVQLSHPYMTTGKNTLEGINRISEAEEQISELTDKMVEITAEEQNKAKRMKRTEDSLRDFWDNIKSTTI